MSRRVLVALQVFGLALVATTVVGCGGDTESSVLHERIYEDSKGDLQLKPQLFPDTEPLAPSDPTGEGTAAPDAGTTPDAGTEPAGGAEAPAGAGTAPAAGGETAAPAAGAPE